MSKFNDRTRFTTFGRRKTSDSAISNTTFQTDSRLLLRLVANSVYQIHGLLHFFTASVNAGAKMRFSGSVGVRHLHCDVFIYEHTGNAHLEIMDITGLLVSVGANFSGDAGVTFDGVISTSTSGTFGIDWAQNTEDGANPTTLHENAYMLVQQLFD